MLQAAVKAGVGIENDAHKLARDHGLRLAGVCDLGALAAARLPDPGKRWSLAGEWVMQEQHPHKS